MYICWYDNKYYTYRTFYSPGTRHNCSVNFPGYSWFDCEGFEERSSPYLEGAAGERGNLKQLKFVEFVDCVWNVMAHAQKPDFVFRRNGRVHLNRRGRQFSRLLAAEVCASAVGMLDTPFSEVVWRVLATHSIRQVPLHSSSRASTCAITFQLDSTQLISSTWDTTHVARHD